MDGVCSFLKAREQAVGEAVGSRSPPTTSSARKGPIFTSSSPLGGGDRDWGGGGSQVGGGQPGPRAGVQDNLRASQQPGVPLPAGAGLTLCRGPGKGSGSFYMDARVPLVPAPRFWPLPWPAAAANLVLPTGGGPGCSSRLLFLPPVALRQGPHTSLGVQEEARRPLGSVCIPRPVGPSVQRAPMSTPTQVSYPFLPAPGGLLPVSLVLVHRLSPGPACMLCEVKTFACCCPLRVWPPGPSLALYRDVGTGC